MRLRRQLVEKTNVDIFFFNDTATTEIYTLSLHDALPIFTRRSNGRRRGVSAPSSKRSLQFLEAARLPGGSTRLRKAFRCIRSEEHTSELQSRQYLVCRLLLEKKK